MPLPGQVLPTSNKINSCSCFFLTDKHFNFVYSNSPQTSYCIYCRSAKQTLHSFLLFFTNFKNSLSKPVSNNNFNINNVCDNTLNSKLKIFYQNVRGLKTKLVSLRCSFPLFHFYDVIILTETWLSPDISDSELGFNDFQIIRLDRNPNNSSFFRGGGVLIAIKATLKFHPISINVSNVEQIFALLSFNSNHLLVGGVYLPPHSPLPIVESHVSSVEQVISCYKPQSIILCGDYNLPNVTWSSDELGLTASSESNIISTTIIDSFSYLNFFQCNSFPNNHGSILDLIFSNSNGVSVSLAPDSLVIPDLYHPPLHIIFPFLSDNKTVNTHTYNDFKAANYSDISQFFNSFNWESTFSLYSIDDAASIFNDALFHSIKLFVPTKIFKLPKFPRWTSSALKNLIMEKKRAHAIFKRSKLSCDYSTFSELRAKCKRLSKLDYQSYIKKTENSIILDPSVFWKFTKNLSQRNSIPSTLRLNNVTADTPRDSANLFSKYFSSVFNTSSSSPSDFPKSNVYPYELPSNCYFTLDDVHRALNSLKNNISNGPDGISARMLFNCRDSFVYPLFLLFRRSLDEGIFPAVWKTCSVTPVFKSGDPSLISNYRPISILPHIAKLFESIIYSSIKRNLNHILVDDQHGFRPGKSTVTCTLALTTYILESFESNCQVDAVFTDFNKAFDTVIHSRLISELASLGIGDPLLSWLQSYLSPRMQFVTVHGATSDLFITPSGVPQGGHLSPLLFILYINSISSYLSFSKILLFADDIKIYSKITSLSDCIKLQSDLDSFCLWTQRIGLTLNLNKCHLMSFCRKRTLFVHPYSLNGSILERVSCVKDLGFFLTPTLSFEHHINITVGRALKVLGFIKRNTSLFTSVTCLRSLYFSLVRSIVEYGIVVWYPYLAKDQLRIERVQNRFLSYAAFLLKIDHPTHDYSSVRSSLNIPTLASRRVDADFSFISSLLNGPTDAPDLLSSIYFRVPIHSSRNHSLFLVPSHRTNYSHNHPLHRMLRLLNNS